MLFGLFSKSDNESEKYYCKRCGYEIHPWRYEQCEGHCEDCYFIIKGWEDEE